MLLAFNFVSKLQNEDTVGSESERALLTPKDEDIASLGSSYDSEPNSDEEKLEDLEARLYEGKAIGNVRSSNSIKQLCVICFDAPKDCFFLPCGHCAACIACSTRYTFIYFFFFFLRIFTNVESGPLMSMTRRNTISKTPLSKQSISNRFGIISTKWIIKFQNIQKIYASAPIEFVF